MALKLFSILFAVAIVSGQSPYATSIEPSAASPDIPANQGSAALWQSLKKLHTRASLMMITAHPDDEDGGMLCYESRGAGARVTLLTLNRGEGGANVMSSDFFDALGLTRTMELLRADQYYGVDQYWTRVIDYGFSKTKAESIGKWTHDRVLYDVVRAVRINRPLVITSVFVGGPSDGHGNHQTAGAMAQEVFRAAGDPNIFPDQIKEGLKTWKPLKDYALEPFQGGERTQLAVNVTIPEGTYDPLLGMSYLQLSHQGLGFQKTQNGGGFDPGAGQFQSEYHRFGSFVPAVEKEKGFFDGLDVSLAGIASLASPKDPGFVAAGLKRIEDAVEQATSEFRASAPEKTAPSLARGLRETMALIDQVKGSSLSEDSKYDIVHELAIKRVQFNNALIEALGLALSGTVAPAEEPNPLARLFEGDPETFSTAIPGQTFKVNVRAANRGIAAVELASLTVSSYEQKTPWRVEPETAGSKLITAGGSTDASFVATVPQNAAYTRPYFSRPNIEQTYYDIRDEKLLGHSLAPYPLAAWADFTFAGVPIRLGQYVQTVRRVAGQGTILDPLVVGPAISVGIRPNSGIVPLPGKAFPITVLIHSNVKGPAKGAVKLDLPSGWTSKPGSAPFLTASDGEDRSVSFQVNPSALSSKRYQITAVAEYQGRSYSEGYQTTGYAGLRPYFLYSPSSYRLMGVDVRVAPDIHAGYVMGSGDDVPSSLEHLGIHTAFLGPTDISTGDLSRYDVILLGVRAYAARDDLRVYNSRLLEYVKNGGVLIVQYNTPEFDHNFGPYHYRMTADPEEVTDEASKVKILGPANPIFNWPNQISDADFAGWVEERGSKWMKSWDSHYQALLETHDEGQSPQEGGLLYAHYGKGIYIYNAYAFYRQLPEGVPGAYRIFANMLSLSKNPQRGHSAAQ